MHNEVVTANNSIHDWVVPLNTVLVGGFPFEAKLRMHDVGALQCLPHGFAAERRDEVEKSVSGKGMGLVLLFKQTRYA